MLAEREAAYPPFYAVRNHPRKARKCFPRQCFVFYTVSRRSMQSASMSKTKSKTE
jgi:hypothetical protein